MFNFMKKGAANLEKEDKEKKKKSDKRDRKDVRERERRSMTAEELLRLDEVRRSFRIGRNRKEKEKLPSGITADYSANFLAELRESEGGESSTEVSLGSLNTLSNVASTSRPLPPVPPLPPKRGILKQVTKSIASPSGEYTERDSIILVRNTLQNEVIAYQNIPCKAGDFEVDQTLISPGDTSSIGSGEQTHSFLTPPVLITNHDSVESLEDSTTNSSFVTPPFSLSPVGDSHGLDVEFPLPEIQPNDLSEPRTLTILRQPPPRSDFGFSLRKAMIFKRDASGNCHMKPVILAEPGTITQHCNDTGLLPGDRLLQVNGQSVDKKTREEVIDMIKSSGTCVTLKVQPVAELSELSYRSLPDGRIHRLGDQNIRGGTLKRSSSYRFTHFTGKCDEEIAVEAEWYWLVHRGGFSQVYLVPNSSSPPGKVTVRLHTTEENIVVDEDDLEKANPKRLDKSENLVQLRFVNESSALHILRQRYASNLIHTYAGKTLLVLNPMAPLAIYSEKVVHMFRGCKSEDMPPHIYSVAQDTYRSMLSSRRDHSIVLLGRSGSGKTANYKHILHYLCLTPGTVNKIIYPDKLQAIWIVLEAFGNAKTVSNLNATRYTHLFGFDFDQSGQITSASIQMLLIDRWRLIKRHEGEGIFNVFYYLLHGAEGTLRRELSLDHLSQNTPLLNTNSTADERNKASLEFTRLCNAFKVLNISQSEVDALWSVVAAILHFGVAGAHKSGTRWQFRESTSAQRACNLLGTSLDEVENLMFGQSSPSHMKTSEAVRTGQDRLEGLIIGLYQEVITVITALINRSMSSNSHGMSSILVLDCPGWQTPSSMGTQYTGSLSDLFQNYLAEKLQSLYYYNTITAPLQKYTQEDIEVTSDFDNDCDNRLLSILESVGSSLGSSSQVDLRYPERRQGILWIIEEMAAQPSSSDQALNDKIFMTYSDRESQCLMSKGPDSHHIILQHCFGSNPVLYSTEGWLKQTRENPVIRLSSSLLQDSTKGNINTLFSTWRSGVLNGSVTGLDTIYTVNRGSSIRRSTASGSSGTKRRSIVLQAKFTIDGLIETIRRTRVNFVHCLLPHETAGLVDVCSNHHNISKLINVPLLRSQLRGGQILNSVRLYKQGFPDTLPLAEFNRKFSLLANIDSNNIQKNNEVKLRTPDQEKVMAIEILQTQELDPSSYRIRVSQVFTRSGILSQLETLRDEKVSDRISKLQALCRGYLARKHFAKRKVEDVAVRCIQRNVRKFVIVRDWPWWRLLIRVTPLLNVHRTEELLKIKTDELEAFKIKLEKLEQERSFLKQENGKLEAKISELAMDLAEEHSSCSFASERLSAEKADRLRLEKELHQLQADKKNLEENSERLEMELVCARTLDVNGIDLESDDGEQDFVSRERYERITRELEYTKRRMHQQHDHDMDQIVGLKKQLEKKLADTYEELEEQRKVVAQWKRKVQKLNAEMNDMRLLLEEQNSRNNLLEKKQRKFDSEFQLMGEELRQEKMNRERAIRERDLIVADKCSIEQNLNTIRLELELKEQHAKSLADELNEAMYSGNTEEDVAMLKKVKHQLESKLKDQEEELDDLAGQVQLLEQAKLKLEMSLEQLRKENRRELAQRDEELDEVRSNAHKKVKALECQLETEHEERTALLRERHELECRHAELEETLRQSQVMQHDHIHKLKSDFKKTKALLRDAQITIQQHRAETPNKSLLRQLRNQLEDAECARATAVKAKQNAEAELSDTVAFMEDAIKAKQDAEEKYTILSREKSSLQLQLEENEEELAEVMKKYKSAVSQMTLGQITLQEHTGRIAELESEKANLKEQVAELQSRLENMETLADPSSSFHVKKYQLKVKELESKLELEQTTKTRIEVQMGRLKETTEKAQSELELVKSREQSAQDNYRKTARTLRETKEQNNLLMQHDTESTSKRKELEKRLESAEAETAAVRADLRLALQRIDDLQCAIQGDLEDGNMTASDSSASETDSSDESLSTFQENSSMVLDSPESFRTPERCSTESGSQKIQE